MDEYNHANESFPIELTILDEWTIQGVQLEGSNPSSPTPNNQITRK